MEPIIATLRPTNPQVNSTVPLLARILTRLAKNKKNIIRLLQLPAAENSHLLLSYVYSSEIESQTGKGWDTFH